MKGLGLGLILLVSTHAWGVNNTSQTNMPPVSPKKSPSLQKDTVDKPLAPEPSLLGEIVVSHTRIPLWKVGDVFGQSKNVEQLVFDHQETLRDMGDQVKSQVCATICQSLTSSLEFGMTVTTVYARAHCPVVPVCPSGMIETKWSVHTKDKENTFQATPVDKMFGEGDSITQEPNMFATKDLQKNFLFLVAPDIVLLFENMNLKIVRNNVFPDEINTQTKTMLSVEETKQTKTTPK